MKEVVMAFALVSGDGRYHGSFDVPTIEDYGAMMDKNFGACPKG